MEQHLDLLTAIVDVPCEGSQFLTQDHLCTGVIDDIVWGVVELTDEMTDTHMSHDKNECDPRHHWSLDSERDGIRPDRARQENPQPIP